MQYVRSKDPFSKKGIQKHPNANSHGLLSRSASCELANVIELNRAMKKRPVLAPSIIRLHSNSFDSSQPQNPSSILTVVATVHPQRPERHRNSLPVFNPSSLTKRWDAKRNHVNLSLPRVRESKTLLDSGFHAMDSGFHLLDSRSFSVELGFRIRIVSGIPDSYTCIPDSKAQDSGFHKHKFPRFRIPNAKISRIPESGFLYMGRLSDAAGDLIKKKTIPV